MGQICSLKSATTNQLNILIRDPDLIGVFFNGEEFPYPPQLSFFQRLFGKKRVIPSEILELTMQTDLDKTWHALHFLFTGTDWHGNLPQAFLLKGGRNIGSDADRALFPKETIVINDFVHSLSDDVLRERFDPEAMTRLKIYPEIIWKRDDPEENLEWLLEHYHSSCLS